MSNASATAAAALDIKWLISPGTATQKRHAFHPLARISLCGRGERTEGDAARHQGNEEVPYGYQGCRGCLAKFEKLKDAAPAPNGPDYCAKPVRCDVCPYPQPCDPQTVRAPKQA